MKNIAVFASGSGTNAEQLMKHFEQSSIANVKLVVSSNASAGVLLRASQFKVPTFILTKKDFVETSHIGDILRVYHIDFVVLAGFLWHIPPYLIKAYTNRMVNIHPSLLPLYGGKGMYGERVHQTVIQNQEKESGITIHYVTDGYDEGAPIFQAKCTVTPEDNASTLAEKVHALEHQHFSRVVEELLLKLD